MTRLPLMLLVISSTAFAQSAEFPSGASPLPAADLKARFTGASYVFRDAKGVEVRLKFGDSNVEVQAPRASDSGPWKAEGSAICIEFTRFKSGCNEVRLAGDQLYWKRNSNDEVVKLNKD